MARSTDRTFFLVILVFFPFLLSLFTSLKENSYRIPMTERSSQENCSKVSMRFQSAKTVNRRTHPYWESTAILRMRIWIIIQKQFSLVPKIKLHYKKITFLLPINYPFSIPLKFCVYTRGAFLNQFWNSHSQSLNSKPQFGVVRTWTQ